MTDNEYIKAFEICYGESDSCNECPYYKDEKCTQLKDAYFMPEKILEIIGRKDAEIDNLNIELKAMRGAANSYKLEVKRLTSGKCVYLSDDETTEYCVEGPCPNYKTVADIKGEAYKELALLLIDKAEDGVIHISDISDFAVELIKENEGK